MAPRCDALVVGSGVIGLTTAICLAEGGARIRIRTAALPQATTSAVAAAMWGPAFMEPADRVPGWAQVSLEEFSRLADVPESGVHFSSGVMAGRPPSEVADAAPVVGPLPLALTEMPGFTPCVPEELPDGFGFGFRVRVPVVYMPRYLDYLTARFADAGGELEVRPVGALSEAAEEAPVVVNCTGIGAGALVRDPELRPVRGQHVVVENPGLDEFFIEAPFGATWAAYFVHGDRVVLGGVAQVDDWNLEPDPAVAEQILQRCAAVQPLLENARVIGHQVGLRPERGGVRLEAEPFGSARCVHAYGHGGSGVSLSWGCAREAAGLAVA